MADSTDKNNPSKRTNQANDLDSMLDDAASSLDESDELMNDDAIDKLLMDNAFDSDQSEDEFDDFDDLFVDDDFADSPVEDEIVDTPGSEVTMDSNLEKEVAQSLANSGDESSLTDQDEIDEFAEISEFSDEDSLQDSISTPDARQDANEDFTLAEFDISDDDFAEPGPEQALASEAVSGRQPENVEAVEADNSIPAPAVDAAITAAINQLINEQAALKQQVGDLSEAPATDENLRTEMAELQQSQKAIKKQLDGVTGNKKPVMTYAALGIAILALILAAALLFMSLGTSSDLEQMTESLAAMEENQEALVIKNNDQELKQISETMAALTEKVTAITTPLNNAEDLEEGAVRPPNLPAMHEELAAAKSEWTKLNESIVALTARIDKLEKNKPAVKPVSKPVQKSIKRKAKQSVKRPVKKRVSTNTRWAVNLVSFRQDWYAKRKAAEYSKQGVPVLVDKVQVKGETWYRLTVPGFKNKNEAAAYADRVKKTFNLDSVWLGKN